MLEKRHHRVMEHLSNSQRLRAIAALAVTVVLWGSAFVAIRAVVAGGSFSPGQLSLARLTIAALLLGVLVAARGGIRIPDRRDMLSFFALGFTGQMLYHLLLNTGERSVDGGTAALLIAVAPMLAALTAVFFLGERLTVWGWIGSAVALVGAATIALASGASMRGGNGVLLVVAATCLWAIYLVLQKTLAGRYDSLELTAWPMWIGAVLLLPWAGGLPQALARAPWTSVAAIVWLGAMCSVAAFMTWAYAIRRLPVTVATSALYTVPVAAFVIGVLFLREMPPASALLGGVLAISGVALVQTLGRPAAGAGADDEPADVAVDVAAHDVATDAAVEAAALASSAEA
jgi:drug/metabolite transporter (DMT)-like permease